MMLLFVNKSQTATVKVRGIDPPSFQTIEWTS